MPDRFRCALASADRAEPLHGTASRVRSWVAIEQPGPWGRDALLESRMDREIARAIAAQARRHRVRVLMLRRPGRLTSLRSRVYLAHSARPASWMEELDVDSPAELLDLDWSAIAAAQPPGYGTPHPESIHLVCTNGRHDACCADLGRPVVRALVAAGAPAVWESSHVGGDRFAANVVCLPSGAYYGRVVPERAAQLLADHDRGLVTVEHYRGRSCDPPLVQVADACARRETGVRELAALPLAGVQALADDTAMVTFLGAGGGEVRVRVQRLQGSATALTCTTEPSHPWDYRLQGVEVD